jgi:hypothetical protein
MLAGGLNRRITRAWKSSYNLAQEEVGMILSKPLFVVLLVAGMPLLAAAADRTSSHPAAFDLKSGQVPSDELTTNSGPDRYVLLSPSGAVPTTPAAFSQALDSQGNVCYTMRTYKVKPQERFAENESARAGYSKCEMASAYRLRSADGVSPARLK